MSDNQFDITLDTTDLSVAAKQLAGIARNYERIAASQTRIVNASNLNKTMMMDFGVSGPISRLERANADRVLARNPQQMLDAAANMFRAVQNVKKIAGQMNAVAAGPAGPKISGPMASLGKAQGMVQAAQTPDQIMDAQIAQFKAQKALHRVQAQMALGVNPSTRKPAFDPDRTQRIFPIRGWHSRIHRAQAQLSAANSPDQMQDAQMQLQVAQMRLLRQRRRGAGGGGIFSRIMDMASASRMGPGGGGAAGVAGRLQDILLALPGGLGRVFGAALALGIGLLEAAKKVHEFAIQVAQSGGTAFRVSLLKNMGVGDVAGESAGLRQRLSHDPLAIMASSRLGLGPMPPPHLGTQDYTKSLIAHLEALRKVKDAEEQLRLARMLGLENMIDAVRVSGFVAAGQRMGAITSGRVMSPSGQQAGRDFMGSMNNVGSSIMNLLSAIFIPVMKILAPALNALSILINAVAIAFDEMLAPLNYMIDAVKMAVEFLDHLFGGNSSSMDDNTDAINANTRAIKEGYFGGGARARGALPPGIGGAAFGKAVEGNSLQHGSFQL